MAKKQVDRYPSVAALADDVRRWHRRRAGLGLPRAVDPAVRPLGEAAPDGRRRRRGLAGHGDRRAVRRHRPDPPRAGRGPAQRNEARLQRRSPATPSTRCTPRSPRSGSRTTSTRSRRNSSRRPWPTTRPSPARPPPSRPSARSAGRAYQRMGDILHKLGRNEEAEKAYRRAIEALDALSTDFPEEPEPRHHAAATRGGLGVLLAERGDNDEADGLFRDGPGRAGAPRLGRRRPRPRPGSTWPGPTRASPTCSGSGTSTRTPRRRTAAPPRSSRRCPRARTTSLPASSWRRPATASACSTRTRAGSARPRRPTRRGLEAIEPLVARYPTMPRLREAMANGLRSVGLIEQSHGDPDQARIGPRPGAGGRPSGWRRTSRSGPSTAATRPSATTTSPSSSGPGASWRRPSPTTAPLCRSTRG